MGMINITGQLYIITTNSVGVAVWIVSGIGTPSTVISKYKSISSFIPQAH
jgi:hypothetical protein